MTALTNSQEGRVSDKPWKLTDAPASYIKGMLSGIVGVEMQIRTLEGKWTISQNRPAADRDSLAKRCGPGALRRWLI